MKIGTGHSNLSISHMFSAPRLSILDISCVRQRAAASDSNWVPRDDRTRAVCDPDPPGDRVSFVVCGNGPAMDRGLRALRPASPSRCGQWIGRRCSGNRLPSTRSFARCRGITSARSTNLHPPSARRIAKNCSTTRRWNACSAQRRHQPAIRRREDDPRIRAAIDHLAAHLTVPISVESIADSIHLSPSHFAHLFREQTGESANAFVERLRMGATRARLTISTTARSNPLPARWIPVRVPSRRVMKKRIAQSRYDRTAAGQRRDFESSAT